MASHAPGHDEASHASVNSYIVVLAILGVLTLLEVGTYFMPWFQAHHGVLFLTLSVMAITKFALVVGWYMHLRYDPPYYTRVFVAPLVIAVAMTVVVALLTATKFMLAKPAP